MTNQTPKTTDREFLLSELSAFVKFIHTIDPELTPGEAMALAGYVLYKLPNLFKENPNILADLKQIAAQFKLQRNNS